MSAFEREYSQGSVGTKRLTFGGSFKFRMPHPIPRAKHKNTPINFKTVISFTDLLTKLST